MKANVFNPSAVNAYVMAINRAHDAVTGDVAYTGVGFKPSALYVIGGDNSNAGTLGFGNVSDQEMVVKTRAGVVYFAHDSVAAMDDDGVNYQVAAIKSLDTDGFTLTWTKAGAGSTADFVGIVVCLR